MDLIDRYLTAVRLLLPAGAPRDDIVAELRDGLMASREDREVELGRPLTGQEDEALLRDFGHPLVVAGRYGREQYLVGPELYALYWLVLKIVLAAVIGSALITGVVTATVAAGDPILPLRQAIGIAWTGAFAAVGAVTVVFAVLQRSAARTKLLSHWNPRDLPRLARPRRVTWFEHVAGIVIPIIFLLWWVGAVPLWRPVLDLQAGQSLQFTLGAVWQGLFWPVIGLALGAVAVHALKLAGGGWGRLAHGLDLVVQGAVLAVAAIVLRAGHWVDISGHGLPAHALASVDLGVNIGLRVTLAIVVIVAACTIAYDAWRVFRPRSAEG
jgi:hypothetical protein